MTDEQRLIERLQLVEALFAGAAFLGDRLSAKGSVYRLPNDLWYHIDFTADWARSVLFDSAATRLASGGGFVLVTASEHRRLAEHPRLQLQAELELHLLSGKRARAFLWRKRSDAAA